MPVRRPGETLERGGRRADVETGSVILAPPSIFNIRWNPSLSSFVASVGGVDAWAGDFDGDSCATGEVETWGCVKNEVKRDRPIAFGSARDGLKASSCSGLLMPGLEPQEAKNLSTPFSTGSGSGNGVAVKD